MYVNYLNIEDYCEFITYCDEERLNSFGKIYHFFYSFLLNKIIVDYAIDNDFEIIKTAHNLQELPNLPYSTDTVILKFLEGLIDEGKCNTKAVKEELLCLSKNSDIKYARFINDFKEQIHQNCIDKLYIRKIIKRICNSIQIDYIIGSLAKKFEDGSYSVYVGELLQSSSLNTHDTINQSSLNISDIPIISCPWKKDKMKSLLSACAKAHNTWFTTDHNISNIDGVLISPLGIFYPINDGNHSLAVGVLENKGTWDFKETSVLISIMSQKNISTNKYNIPSKYIHPKLFLLNELGIILSNANIDIAYI